MRKLMIVAGSAAAILSSGCDGSSGWLGAWRWISEAIGTVASLDQLFNII